MVYHLKPCRDKLDFCPDEFFTDTYQGTATLFAYHLAFVDDMKDLLVRKILYQFSFLAGVFSFAEVFLDFYKGRFCRVGISSVLYLIKKRHLSLYQKDGCLLGFGAV